MYEKATTVVARLQTCGGEEQAFGSTATIGATSINVTLAIGWCLLKCGENRTRKQTQWAHELMKRNLRTMRAYLLKEEFQQFWTYGSPTWAGKFLDALVHPCDAKQP